MLNNGKYIAINVIAENYINSGILAQNRHFCLENEVFRVVQKVCRLGHRFNGCWIILGRTARSGHFIELNSVFGFRRSRSATKHCKTIAHGNYVDSVPNGRGQA